ncbi:hypothetical protein PSSHI_10110 [Photobacterium sp. R1]
MEVRVSAPDRGAAHIASQFDKVSLVTTAALKFVAVFVDNFVEKRPANSLRHTFAFAVRAHKHHLFYETMVAF